MDGQTSEREIIEKLQHMPSYQGFLKPDGNVHIPWNIGIDSVSLETFLKGTIQFKQKTGRYGSLKIPFSLEIFYGQKFIRDSVNSRVGRLEDKYPVRCSLESLSVDELQASHFFHTTHT